MPTIDLSERRKLTKATTVRAGGRTYTLSGFLPASVMAAVMDLRGAKENPSAGAQAVRDLFIGLFGAKDADQAMKDISLAEATNLMEEVGQVSAGESRASVSSSPNGGKRPRRTSPVSTGSI